MNKLYIYNSLNQWRAELETAPTGPLFADPAKQDSHGTDDSTKRFTMTESYEAADDLLLKGDSDSAKMIVKFTASAKPVSNVLRRRPVTAVVGCLPHVPNFVAGRPNSMISYSKQPKRERVITIVVNNSTPGSTKAETLAENSAKIVSAIKAIEANGTRVNLYLYIGGRSGDETAEALIKIKDSSKYLETEKLGYTLINPSMLRRHFFRFIETRQELTRRQWVSGYGACIFNDKAEDTLKRNNVKYNAIIEVGSVRSKTPEDIVKMITG